MQFVVLNDYLIAIANMAGDDKETSLQIHRPDKLRLSADSDYILFDLSERTTKVVKDQTLPKALRVRAGLTSI